MMSSRRGGVWVTLALYLQSERRTGVKYYHDSGPCMEGDQVIRLMFGQR